MSSHKINMNMSDDRNESINLFLQLLSANYHRIHGYILSLVPVRTYADDIMQETTLIMWKKYPEFEAGSDFVSWGIAIARYLILDYRKDKNNRVLHLDDKVFQNIVSQSEEHMRDVDQRIDALKHCVKKLPDKDRHILQLRFESEMPTKSIADRLGKSTYAIYRALARIQDVLARCIRRTLVTEEI